MTDAEADIVVDSVSSALAILVAIAVGEGASLMTSVADMSEWWVVRFVEMMSSPPATSTTWKEGTVHLRHQRIRHLHPTGCG